MTLVEVIMAVAILSAGMVALLTAGSRCVAVMKAARNYQTAQWTMGRGEADYPILETNDIDTLEVAGESYPGGFVYSRKVDEKPFDEKNHLYILRIQVQWGGDDGTVEEVVRCIYQPPDEEGK
jgi:hypothetical protein